MRELTQLGLEERDSVWREKNRDWPFYAWKDSHWRAYPVDPRTNPQVMSVPAHTDDCTLVRAAGFIEVEGEHS